MATIISGTTGVSQVQDGSVTQAKLAPNVSGNGPAFSVYQNSVQAFPAATETKMQFQGKEFDTAAAFDVTTNYRFQPTVSGYYQIEGNISFGTNVTAYLAVYKNGAKFKQGAVITNCTTVSLATLVYLNGSTDYIELWGFTSSAQNSASGAALCYFQGFLARAA
jgi:hypothetical protein